MTIMSCVGLKKDSVSESDYTKIVLHASGVIKDIPIGVLSDEEFSEVTYIYICSLFCDANEMCLFQ